MYTPEFIRNIGIAAHVDAGKTTLTERILYFTGRIRRAGEVHHGTTTTDYLPEERERGITITAAATYAEWSREGQPYTINIIDTPGHVDFTVEVERSLRVLDGAITVLDASQGVEPQTETVWHQAERYRVPRLVFVNKMDKVGADFPMCLSELREKLGALPLPVQWPVTGEEGELLGAVDLLEMQLIRLTPTPTREPIPSEWQDQAQLARTALIESLAETNDSLLDAYLNGAEIETPTLRRAIREATLALRGFPVLCGSALRDQGIQPLLDAVVDYLPGPLDLPPLQALTSDGHEVTVTGEDPLALAFKTVADAFGTLTFVRVYRGTLTSGMTLLNTRTGERERAGAMVRVHADQTVDLPELNAGEIGAMRNLKRTRTGDTLTVPQAPALHLGSLTIPAAVLSMTIEARSAEEQPRLLSALQRAVQDDPTLHLDNDGETGLLVLSGMGELHLSVVLDRLERETGLHPRAGEPGVAYRETIGQEASVTHQLSRQVGHSNASAEVGLRVTPRAPGSGNEVVNALPGECLPPPLLAAALQGIEESLPQGPRGYPLTDVAVTLQAAKAHPTESNELAFRLAATAALREALAQAKPMLLEPVMQVDVTTPETFMGTVVGDLSRRGGEVQGMEGRGHAQVVRAHVPLAKLFGYATELRSMTQGRASFSMTPSHYAPVQN